jgi:hypothetical protein
MEGIVLWQAHVYYDTIKSTANIHTTKPTGYDTKHNLFRLLEYTQGETKVTIKSTLWIDSTGLSPRSFVNKSNWISFPHKRQSMIGMAIPPRCENTEIKKKGW